METEPLSDEGVHTHTRVRAQGPEGDAHPSGGVRGPWLGHTWGCSPCLGAQGRSLGRTGSRGERGSRRDTDGRPMRGTRAGAGPASAHLTRSSRFRSDFPQASFSLQSCWVACTCRLLPEASGSSRAASCRPSIWPSRRGVCHVTFLEEEGAVWAWHAWAWHAWGRDTHSPVSLSKAGICPSRPPAPRGGAGTWPEAAHGCTGQRRRGRNRVRAGSPSAWRPRTHFGSAVPSPGPPSPLRPPAPAPRGPPRFSRRGRGQEDPDARNVSS